MTAVVHDRTLLTLRETAERLRVSERTVRRLIALAELPALRVGGQLRFDQAELEQWLFSDPKAAA